MRAGRAMAYAALAAAAWMVPAGAAMAGKPSSGGGGGTTPPGTICFSRSNLTTSSPTSILSMDGAGGNLRTLATNVPASSPVLHASRELHGGRRWFLALEVVPGETGIQGSDKRYDVFAVREDGGANVRLTADPTLQFLGYGGGLAWAPDENDASATVSFLARQWTGTSASDTVVPGTSGLYTAQLGFDSLSGDVNGLGTSPALLVSLGVTTSGGHEMPDVRSYSWSPDMTRVACDRLSTRLDLRVIDVATGAATVIAGATSSLSMPVWSPDGSKIAFVRTGSGRQNPYPSIVTVSPTGASEKVLFKASSSSDILVGPTWSPDSAHVAFGQDAPGGDTIRRVAASGGSATVLYTDAAGITFMGDWR